MAALCKETKLIRDQIQEQMKSDQRIHAALISMGWLPPGESINSADVRWAIDRLTYGQVKEAKELLIRSIQKADKS